MQNLVEVESHSTLLESHWEQSCGSTCPGSEPEVALQRNPAHTSLHTIKKASYLLAIPLQGGVMNKLAFPPHFLFPVLCACTRLLFFVAGKFWRGAVGMLLWRGSPVRGLIASCLQFAQSKEVLKS